MTKLNLKELEIQTDALLKACDRLKQENQYLLEKQSQLISERNQLKEKNRIALLRIQKLISKLKQSEDYHDSI